MQVDHAVIKSENIILTTLFCDIMYIEASDNP